MKKFAVFGKEEFKHGSLSDKGQIQKEIMEEIADNFFFCFSKNQLDYEGVSREAFRAREFFLHSDNDGHLKVEYVNVDTYPYGYKYSEEERSFIIEVDPDWEIFIRKYALEIFSQGLPERIFAFSFPKEIFLLEVFRILMDEYLYQWGPALSWMRSNIYFFECWNHQGEIFDSRLMALKEELDRNGEDLSSFGQSQDLHQAFWNAYERVKIKKEKDLRKNRQEAQNKDLNYPNPQGVWIGADQESRAAVKAQVDEMYQELIHCPQIDCPDMVFSLEGEGHFAFNQDIRLRQKIKLLPWGFYTDYYVSKDSFLKEFYESMGMTVIGEEHFNLMQLSKGCREEEYVPASKIRGSMEIKVYGAKHKKMDLVLYEDEWTMKRSRIPMKKQGDYFTINLPKRLFPSYYNILVDDEYEVIDPYARALSQNNRRGYMFLDTWIPRFKGNYIEKPSFPSIYELHVKDFTINGASGAANPGTFDALVEKGLKVRGKAIGFDHLVNLGVDYVHLLPIHNFLTMWEQRESLYDQDNYNWGYDPDHYFALENSYATDPRDPKTGLIAFRKLVDAFHSKGIGVIMDVVFNHLYLGQYSDIAFLEPDAIRRTPEGYVSNGSGTGSELASEHPYIRQLILDSIDYFQDLGVDGFRFDLAALTDKDTFYAIEEKSREKNPHTILYGEPWMAAESVLAGDMRLSPNEHNMYFFDNWYRDAIRGSSHGLSQGYIQGEFHAQEHILNSLKGLGQFKHSLSYFSCHDDHVLMDYLDLSFQGQDMGQIEADKKDLVKLAFSLLAMTPMPILFHEGDEFGRRRYKMNPYNGPLENVEMKWEQLIDNYEIADYIKDLLQMRSKLPLEGLEEYHIESGLLVLKSREEEYLFFFNNHKDSQLLEKFIEKDQYVCLFDERGITEKKLLKGQILPAKSFYLCKKI